MSDVTRAATPGGRSGAPTGEEPTLAAKASPPQRASDEPTRFGRYRVLAPIGEGGMGAVYLALDEVLEREVAVKSIRLPRGAAADLRAMLIERFVREGRALARVAHPNVVRVHDVGTHDELPYLVMERVRGPSLRDRLRGGPLPVDDALSLGLALASALEAAHAAEILHRDVKPANVLYSTDAEAWVLADFGIARMPRSNLTQLGQFLGTPSYAAPEALLRGELTEAGDVYAWGATLYAALTGAPPYGDADLGTVIDAQAKGPPRLPAGRAPRPLADLVNAALDTDPARRPTARALFRALSARHAHTRLRLLALGGVGLFSIGAIAGLVLGLAIRSGEAPTPSAAPRALVTTPHPGSAPAEPPAPSDEDYLDRWQAIASLVNAGDYARARPLLRQLLARYPDDTAALDLLDRIDAYEH